MQNLSASDLLQSYLLSHQVGHRYRESLTRTVKRMAAGGLSSLTDLEPGRVNRFLLNLSTPSQTTKANIRRELLTLWRWAYEEGMCDTPPLRVVKIRASIKPPEAWSLQELGRMIACAEQDTTPIGGISAMRVCDYMPCWIAVAYDTGLRFGDVLSLQCSQIRNGFVLCVASKTGKAAVRPLSPYAINKCASLASCTRDGSMFLWFLTRRRAFLAMRGFLDRHGFVGSGKYLRRSCATYIESASPGMATRYLQHSEPSLARKHYVDESLLAAPLGPPPIASLNNAVR